MEQTEFELEAKRYLGDLQEEITNVEALIFNFSSPEKFNESKQELTRLIHSMKGTSGSYGYELLSLVCHKIEDKLFSSSNNTIESTIDSLLELNDKLLEILNYYKNEDTQKLNEIKYNLRDKKTLPSKKTNSNPQIANSIKEQRGNILICENSRFLLNTLGSQANTFDVDISYAKDGYDALGRMLVERFDLVIISKHIPVIEALPLIHTISSLRDISGTKFVLITSSPDHKGPQNNDISYILKDENLFINFKKILSDNFNTIKTKEDYFRNCNLNCVSFHI